MNGNTNSTETNFCLMLDITVCLLKYNHTAEPCLCDKYHFLQKSDHFL